MYFGGVYTFVHTRTHARPHTVGPCIRTRINMDHYKRSITSTHDRIQHTHIHIGPRTYTHTRTHAHTLYTHIHCHIRTYVCTLVRTHKRTHAHTRTHIHTYTRSPIISKIDCIYIHERIHQYAHKNPRTPVVGPTQTRACTTNTHIPTHTQTHSHTHTHSRTWVHAHTWVLQTKCF